VLAIGLLACENRGTENTASVALMLGGGSLISIGFLVPQVQRLAATLVAADLTFISVEAIHRLASLQISLAGAGIVLAAVVGSSLPLVAGWRYGLCSFGCGLRVLCCLLLSCAVLTAKWCLWPAYSCVLWAYPVHVVWRVYYESGMSGGRFLLLMWAVCVVMQSTLLYHRHLVPGAPSGATPFARG
jgi:hypothetical protein